MLAAHLVDPSAAAHSTSTERRVVSVLFVDLVGFTSFSESRDPEDVRELVTAYFEMAQGVVRSFGGTVDKFIGDAVMAWWGADASREDDAERAVRAALEIVERVGTLDSLHAVEPVAARAGVMTGEVVVGPGGNERGLVLGDLVNSASRLQSSAEPGSVLVGEATASLVESAIELGSAQVYEVKGKTQPLTAQQAIRVAAERGGRGRPNVLEPPFIGREAELRLLKDALEATVREGRARLVSVVGQPGIGKSRLVREFKNYVDGLVDDVYWHEGRSPSYGERLSLWALGEMIRMRARISETDPDTETATKLETMVEGFLPSDQVGWVTDRLKVLLGLDETVRGDRSEIFAAARRLFEAIAAEGPTVLVFEDLHGADAGLLEFIEELTEWSAHHPLLVVTVARPDLLDRRPDWGSGRRGFISAYLGPLPSDELARMIEQTVEGMSDDAVRRIVDASGGVPLFAVEMLRSLAADGRLSVSDGRGTVVGDLTTIEVPSTVQAVIAARIDRLPEDERDLVRDVSVLGHSFTLDAVSALRDEVLDKTERRMAGLVRHEIVEIERDPRSPERGQYRWVQPLLREVAYARIARADRARLHRKAAGFFRSQDDAELAPIVAAHLAAAVELSDGADTVLQDEMVEAIREAIARAKALHAHEQVLSLVEMVVGAVPPVVAAELHDAAAVAAVRLHDHEEADRHAGALEQLAGTVAELRHQAVATRGWVLNSTERGREAAEIMGVHLASNPRLDLQPDLARIGVYQARALLLSGEDREAARLAGSAIAAAEAFELVEETADAMITKGTAISQHQPNHGMALLRGALDLCEKHDIIGTRLRCLINIGYASQDPEETMDASRRAFDLAKRVGDRGTAIFVAHNLAVAHLWQLQLRETLELMADPVMTDDDPRTLMTMAQVQAYLGDRASADQLVLRAQRELEGMTDMQLVNIVDVGVHELRLLDGAFEEAFDASVDRFTRVPFAPWLAIDQAARAVGFVADGTRIDRLVAMAEALPPSDFRRSLLLWGRCLEGVITGLDTQRTLDAWTRLDRDLSTVRQERARFFLTLGLASLLPSDHEARAGLIQDGLAIADGAGADGLRAFALQTVG